MIATLFDFNGVLVDDEAVHLEAFRDALAPLGVPLTEEAYVERYLGYDDAGAFRAILVDHGRPADDAQVAALIEAKKPLYMQRIAAKLTVFPGAAALVRRRASRGVVGIVSGALEHEIRYCLDRLGVTSDVAFIVSAEQTRACKPDPEGYLLAKGELARRGAAGARAVVIEDSIAGVQAAKRAGLRCVAVAHSYPQDELRRAGADLVAEDLSRLDDAALDG